uniref:Uncharacterized protein n=1 Tax=Timema cristinae TaxID=61476 RepID=A0A7R9DN93_TIMCR|nr:unnamed protein product [Timema cristinae]
MTPYLTADRHRHHQQQGIICCGELALRRSSLKREGTFPPSALWGPSVSQCYSSSPLKTLSQPVLQQYSPEDPKSASVTTVIP